MVVSLSSATRRLLTFASALALTVSAASAEAATGENESGSNPRRAERGSDGHDDGLLGPVRLGAFAGVGFPRPLSIEGMVKIHDLVGLGIEYSTLPKISVSGVDTTLSAIAADVRVFPFRGGFFVGLAAGHQQLDASTVVALPAAYGSLTEQVSADTWFVNPRIGYLWTTRWGLTVGIDAGAQIPVSASFGSTLPSQIAMSQTAIDVTHAIGKDVLPTIDLLRLGMLF